MATLCQNYFENKLKHLFSTITLKNDCNLNCTLMPVTSIMQLLHAFFFARGNIVRIDSCTDDSIRISLTVAIRLIGAPVNRYTPNSDPYLRTLHLTLMVVAVSEVSGGQLYYDLMDKSCGHKVMFLNYVHSHPLYTKIYFFFTINTWTLRSDACLP